LLEFIGDAVLPDTDFSAQKRPAALQATGPIIRAIVSLIENRDMAALLAVSPVLGNRAAGNERQGCNPGRPWITTI
jgi:hypothetical protein